MNAPATQACAQCGRQVPMQALVYDGQARLICASCEGDAEMHRASSDNVMKAGIAPPVLALLATLMFCVPFLNLIAPFGLGVVSILASIQAIRLGADRTNPGVTANSQPLLIISGILSGLWALGVIGIQVLAWFGMAIGSGAGRYY